MIDSTNSVPKRVAVSYRFDALNWEFIRRMADIAGYAAEKYGSPEQYATARLTGEKSPMNHMIEHYKQYMAGEKYDHFDGDPRWHLAAIAYNASMEFLYHTKFGHLPSPLIDPKV